LIQFLENEKGDTSSHQTQRRLTSLAVWRFPNNTTYFIWVL